MEGKPFCLETDEDSAHTGEEHKIAGRLMLKCAGAGSWAARRGQKAKPPSLYISDYCLIRLYTQLYILYFSGGTIALGRTASSRLHLRNKRALHGGGRRRPFVRWGRWKPVDGSRSSCTYARTHSVQLNARLLVVVVQTIETFFLFLFFFVSPPSFAFVRLLVSSSTSNTVFLESFNVKDLQLSAAFGRRFKCRFGIQFDAPLFR